MYFVVHLNFGFSVYRCFSGSGFFFHGDQAGVARRASRLGFVPEARKKLAGGEAQRNHRKSRTEECCAPAGRESRETPLSRLATATLNHWQHARPASNPVGALGPGQSKAGSIAATRRGGVLSRLSRPAGAQRSVGVGGPVVPLRSTTG